MDNAQGLCRHIGGPMHGDPAEGSGGQATQQRRQVFGLVRLPRRGQHQHPLQAQALRLGGKLLAAARPEDHPNGQRLVSEGVV